MAVKLISVGDQHCDSVPPSSRRDNYWQSIRAKFSEIKEIALQRQVDGVVWLGDMFHKQDAHRVPYHVTNWLMKYFGSGWGQVTNFVVQGNHDVKATPQNWRRQPIGTLVASGVVRPLWSDVTPDNPWGSHSESIADDSTTLVNLAGNMFSYESDLPANRATFYAHPVPSRAHPKRPAGFNIMAMHTAVVPDGETTFGHYSNPKDIDAAVPPGLEAHLYLCGHMHDFYGSFGTDRIRFMNLGSLARGSIDEYNLKRKVLVGYIEVEKANHTCSACGGIGITEGPTTECPTCRGAGNLVDQPEFEVSLEEIELKSAKPAKDIFYVKEFQRKKQRVEELDRLAEMLSAGTIANEFRIINPVEALEVVLRANKVKKPVERMVRDVVDEARRELNQ